MSEQRTQENLLPSSSNRLTEIRLILIGGRGLCGQGKSGKSSSGNIILGRNAFTVGRRTARSVKAEGEVQGRHVTVVDTPGWWWHYSVEDTPYFDQQQIMRSPTLCPPGPHAFLLVIPMANVFPKIYRMALEEHLNLCENIWQHIIVLFSCITPHDDTSFKDHLLKWPDLQMVLEKCHNRFHVLNINNKDDSSQVITLMEKIEEMVAQNNHNYFKISKFLSEDEKVKLQKKRVKRIIDVKRKRAKHKAHIKGDEQYLTEIQIVILGGLFGGKSSAGNLILGREAFQCHQQCQTVSTGCCEVSHAEVHGRMITVVDTPGWYYIHPLEKTPEINKLEIRRSVYNLEPHVILLTVPIDTPFNKSVKTSVEEHMSLLGKKVWGHTIILFTFGDWLGDTTIEERLEEEGEHLMWLLDQCGWRYHVFNSKHQTNRTQVTELLQKIEEMMENNGCCYVPDEKSNPYSELELKLKKAKINKVKERRQRDILQELLKERKSSLSEMRIVLLGAEGVGKSTSGNIIMKRSCFEKTYAGFKVQRRKRQCLMEQGEVDGRQVSLVDTPGWAKSCLENTQEILQSVRVCSPGPHAFLLVLPLNESFTKKSEQAVMELMSLFGERVWRHTLVLLFGYWMIKRPVEQYIECEGEALQSLIRKCGNRYCVLINNWSNENQVMDLFKMIEEMVAKNRGEYFTLEKTASVFQRFTGKVLTEQEWNKREDELIQKMLEAAVVDLDEEPDQLTVRRRGSFDHKVPSMGEDSFSDTNSSVGGDTVNTAVKVSQWLWNQRNKAPSSGYDTMSITSSQYSKK